MLMFKKLLSALTVMLFVCGINAGAQELQKAYLGQITPKFANKTVMTSKVELGASEFWAGYWDGVVNDETQMVGVQQVPMDYGCAIHYPAGSAVVTGKTIEGIKFSFPDSKNIDNVKIFLATKLPQTAEGADICYQEVTDITGFQNAEDPFNEVRFNTPYKVDSSKDLYIGYFFTVTAGSGNAEKFPCLIQGGPDKKDALWLSFGGEPWADYNGNGFGVLAMQALMSGVFEDNAVSIAGDLGTITGSKGSFELPIVVENAGNNGIENLSLEVTVGDVKTTVDVKADKKITGIGKQFAFKANVNTPEATGNYNFTVKVTKVNGVDPSSEVMGNGKMIIISKIAPHKVFVEEFTGMWCGWCPRGMVGLEKMHQVYGENVVTVAAHSGDALDCKDYAKVLKTVAGFPGAHVDRVFLAIDPYYGTSQADFGIGSDIDKRAAIVPVASIEAKPVVNGDILTANAEATFYYSGDASDYKIGYVLVENGMTNNKWSQANNYAQFKGQGLENIEPLFEPWVNGKSQMKDVTFNEVAIAAKGIETGIVGSIPAEVTEDVAVSHSEEFDLSKYKKIINRDNLCLVTVLFDAKGEVVNADMTPLTDINGIEDVTSSENVKEVARYTVDGARINAAQKGINLVKYSDGTVKKVLVK